MQRVQFLGLAMIGVLAAAGCAGADDPASDVSPGGSETGTTSAPTGSASVSPVGSTSAGATSTAGTTSTAGETSSEPAPAGVSFATDIYPIFSAKCGEGALCHGDNGAFARYASAAVASAFTLASRDADKINMRLQAGTMPADADLTPLCQGADGKPDTASTNPKCLTQAELELVAEWVAAGAPE